MSAQDSANTFKISGTALHFLEDFYRHERSQYHYVNAGRVGIAGAGSLIGNLNYTAPNATVAYENVQYMAVKAEEYKAWLAGVMGAVAGYFGRGTIIERWMESSPNGSMARWFRKSFEKKVADYRAEHEGEIDPHTANKLSEESMSELRNIILNQLTAGMVKKAHKNLEDDLNAEYKKIQDDRKNEYLKMLIATRNHYGLEDDMSKMDKRLQNAIDELDESIENYATASNIQLSETEKRKSEADEGTIKKDLIVRGCSDEEIENSLRLYRMIKRTRKIFTDEKRQVENLRKDPAYYWNLWLEVIRINALYINKHEEIGGPDYGSEWVKQVYNRIRNVKCYYELTVTADDNQLDDAAYRLLKRVEDEKNSETLKEIDQEIEDRGVDLIRKLKAGGIADEDDIARVIREEDARWKLLSKIEELNTNVMWILSESDEREPVYRLYEMYIEAERKGSQKRKQTCMEFERKEKQLEREIKADSMITSMKAETTLGKYKQRNKKKEIERKRIELNEIDKEYKRYTDYNKSRKEGFEEFKNLVESEDGFGVPITSKHYLAMRDLFRESRRPDYSLKKVHEAIKKFCIEGGSNLLAFYNMANLSEIEEKHKDFWILKDSCETILSREKDPILSEMMSIFKKKDYSIGSSFFNTSNGKDE